MKQFTFSKSNLTRLFCKIVKFIFSVHVADAQTLPNSEHTQVALNAQNVKKAMFFRLNLKTSMPIGGVNPAKNQFIQTKLLKLPELSKKLGTS